MNGSAAGPTSAPERPRAALLALGALAVAVALISLTVWSSESSPPPGRSPEASPSLSAGSPSSSPFFVPSTPPGSPNPNGPWGTLALEPLRSVAELTATRIGPAGVAIDTAFTLTSVDTVDAVALAHSVVVTPALDMTVTTGADRRSARLQPTEALVAGRLYRFTLAASDGTSLGSWAFQAAAPLHVVTTVPSDQATNVPLDTGIELTFDQDGAMDAASRFSIEPAVAGRFEQHGRTLAFVPERLEPATLYTVTLARGVRLEGSDQVLEQDVVVRFETAPAPGTAEADVTYRFGRPMVEARTGARAVLAVSTRADPDRQSGASKKPFDIAVYRLASERAAIDAIRALAATPDWVRWSSGALVSTDGLSRAGSFTVTPAPIEGSGASWIRLPVALPAGWYLVDVPGAVGGAQTVLQVTDLGAYVAAATDRMVVWANDIVGGQPVEGAVVEVVGGATVGRTDAQGLLVAGTPVSITSAATSGGPWTDRPFLAVRDGGGRSLVVPVGLAESWPEGYYYDQWSGSDPRDVRDRFWRLMTTDRWQYRPTDTVNVWGFLRERDTDRVPDDIEIRLATGGCCWGEAGGPPIATVRVRPDPAGAFAESISVSGLPYGGYELQLWSGEERIADSWIEIALIRKPAFGIELDSDRHILIAGDRPTLTARATFFDGTAVPGAALEFDAFGKQTVTTDPTGAAAVRARATIENEYERSIQASVRPVFGEEGEVAGSTPLFVLPAAVRLEAEATIENGRVNLTGSLHEVAVERLERAFGTDAWETVDWNGAAVPGSTVEASIVELVPVRKKTGQTYDFIAKKVVDTYEYRVDEVGRGTKTIRTAADGSLRLTVPAKADRDYRIVLSARDTQGRTDRIHVYATDPSAAQDGPSFAPWLELACGRESSEFAIGDPICLSVENGRGPLPSGAPNRYLFITSQRGLRDASVTDVPEFRSTFTAADVPNVEIRGAWFNGSTFVPLNPFGARFDPAERQLTVTLAADRGRYAPGETVSLAVRTTDRAGAPISASVVLRAVDEKVYAMGAAADEDLVRALYRTVGSWLVWTHASHPLPRGIFEGGMGDTTGDARQEFLDELLFRQVTTDADGRAGVSFKLSDDLTSWHVSAAAMTSVPEAGSASILVPVGLPFFVEATIAPEHLVGDEPVLRLRAFGSGLSEGDPVTFSVSSTSLGLPKTTVRGRAFEDVELALPALTLGEHAVTIAGSSGAGANALSDALVRRFNVIRSRLLGATTAYTVVATGTRPEGGPGFTDYLFTDAGRGRYLPVLQSLAWSGGPRVDQALAATIARDMLTGEFGVDPATLPPATFDPGAYQHSGIALLPYSSPDPGLTARAALLAGDRFDPGALADTLSNAVRNESSTREQRALAYAGLAGLGMPVLENLRQLSRDQALTIRERLYVALGFEALGDDASARRIERDLLAAYGERRGPWIRLRVGESLDDTIEATSLLALLAAGLGDPLADDAEAYVDANPALDDLYSLQQVAFVERMLERTPAEAARFAYTVDGTRTVVDLEPGDSHSIRLVEAQRRTLSLEPLSGRIGLATSWQVPIEPESVTRDEDLQLDRSYTPSPSISRDSLVEVRLTATFGPQAVASCHQVTDLVPSGLAPIETFQAWPDDGSPDDGSSTSEWIYPYRIQGQRVSFCAGPSKDSRTVKMRYFARIVTAGTYTWEPAVIQSSMTPESINLTTARQVTIR